MKLEQIKEAIKQGKTVHWASRGYEVIRSTHGEYLIQYQDGNCIGLTHLDNITMNGQEDQFFIPDTITEEIAVAYKVLQDAKLSRAVDKMMDGFIKTHLQALEDGDYSI